MATHGVSLQTHVFATSDEFVKEIGRLGVSAAAGTLLGCALSLVHPLGGAIFCATSALTGALVDKFIEKFEWGGDPTATKVARWAIVFVCSMAIGALVVSAAGFPVTIIAAVAMTGCIQLTSAAIKWAYSR